MADGSIDEFTLLCERCGYVIEGLPLGGGCPECGKPIAESLPGFRQGSPWQRGPGKRAWLATAWQTLTAPRRTAASLRVQSDVRLGLFARHTAAASIVAAVIIMFGTPWVREAILGYSLRSELAQSISRPDVLAIAILGVAVILAGAGAAIILLSWIERRGIQFFSRRRGGRVTPTIARVVIAHAAVGWPLAVIGAILGGVTAEFLLLATRCDPGPLRTAILQLPWLLALPGFLFFEWFAYLGMRSMRFANRAREV